MELLIASLFLSAFVHSPACDAIMSCGIMPSSRLRPIVHGNRPCLAATLTVLIGVVSVRVSAFLPAGSGAGTAVLAPPAVQRHKIFNQRVHEHTTAASGRTDVRRRDMIPALAAGDADDFPENTAGGDSDRGSGSSDGSENVWARSELPLSNDQQVEQATGAVWKVRYTALRTRLCTRWRRLFVLSARSASLIEARPACRVVPSQSSAETCSYSQQISSRAAGSVRYIQRGTLYFLPTIYISVHCCRRQDSS